MKKRSAIAVTVAVAVAYVTALVLADARNAVFAQLPRVAAALPVLMIFSLASYGLRYVRWHWLLRRVSQPVPLVQGFMAYLSGFAFTATPGKVGELVRIRYFVPMGVHPSRVLATFVYERATDLLAVLALAALAVQDAALFGLLLGFVACMVGIVALLGARPRPLQLLIFWLRQRRWRWAARAVDILRRGLSGCAVWLTPLDLCVSLVLSAAAWGLTAFAFAWLLQRLGIDLAAPVALSIYPTAMLAGAASMMPGGVGPTEVVVVALLAAHAVPLGAATLSAVAIRLSSMWFSVLCGFLAIGWLERGRR